MKAMAALPNGAYTAALTPLKKDLSIDHKALALHSNWLLENGSTGILLMGTTGEANSFSVAERKELLDEAIKRGVPAEKLMVGTGCCAFPDTVALTKHAVGHNVGGVVVLPPFYYKQVTEDGLMKSFDLLINQVGGQGPEIYLYHFPKMAGVAFSLSLIQRLVKEYPGIIVGMKDSTGDFENVKRTIENVPGFNVYAGTEKLLLDTLKTGGAGCISATANVTIPLVAEVFKTWQTGKSADQMQDHLIAVRTAFEGLPFSGALKSLISKWTGNVDWLNVRPPNTLLDSKDLNTLEARLQALNFKADL